MMIWYFMNALVQLVDGDYLLYPTCWSSKLVDDFIPLSWDSFWWFSNFWVICFYPLLSGSLTIDPTFKDPSTPSKVFFFPQGLCFMVFIMSFPILLWIFKMIPYVLVEFWRLWLFDYPFSFTLVFPTQKLMNWHDTGGILSIGVSRTYVQYFSSIRWGSPNLLAFQC